MEDSVAQAVSLMRDDDLSCVLVMEKGSLAGIFTERDFLTRVVGNDRTFAEIPISEVMTREPITLASDAGIAFAINEMAIGGFRNLPIVEGKSVQLLTVHDVIQHLAKLFDDLDTSVHDDSDDTWLDLGGQG
jgi:CBS domain-containing protein